MKEQNNNNSRRKFIQQTAIAGAGIMLAHPIALFSQTNKTKLMSNLRQECELVTNK
ncbi:MAG: twin-arginine translocation signal domain-containing protein [Ginsengibacter sp.]